MKQAQSADGVVHEFPDETADAIVDRVMKEYAQAQPSPWLEQAKDIGRGVVHGLARGVEELPAPIPGAFARKMLMKPWEGLIEKYGPEAQAKEYVDEPHTPAGKATERVAGAAPSAPFQPGGPITKAVTTLGVGLGEYEGERVAEGLGLPSWVGRLGGGVLGGGLSGVASAERTAAGARSALGAQAGEAAARKSAKGAYDAIAQARLKIEPAAIDQFVTDTKTVLDDDLLVEASSPRSFRALDKLQSAGGDISNLMATYERLGKITGAAGDDYAAATIVREQIGDFLDKLTHQQVITGDPKFTAAMWDHAKAEWRAAKKLEEVRRAQELAKERAARTGTGANKENVLRQEIGKIFDSEKRSRGYTPEQKEQLENIVIGDWLRNSARFAGKYAPSGPVSAAGAVLTGLELGAPAGTAFALATTTAKYLGEYLTRRQIKQLEEMLMRSSPLGKGAAAPPEGIAAVATARGALMGGAGSPLTEPQD